MAISLVTRRDWVVRQLGRLQAIQLQHISVSFGRHVLAALPSWLRSNGGEGGLRRSSEQPQQPDPRDVRMLERLAALFSATSEAHFVMHDHGLEESIHSQPWGLPAPGHAADALAGGGAGGAAGPGPVGEGVEQQPPQQQQQQQQQQQDAPQQHAGGPGAPPPDGGDFELPLLIRLMAHTLASILGPRAAVQMMTPAMMEANDLGNEWQVRGWCTAAG